MHITRKQAAPEQTKSNETADWKLLIVHDGTEEVKYAMQCLAQNTPQP
jgi:hypothetical protein